MILRPRNWELMAAEPVNDVSFGKPGIAYTDLLYRRRRDGKYAHRRIRGHWELCELDPSGETGTVN